MAVFCGNCGEELLGAVNRCWRCGHVFDGVPDEGGQPPVRHPAPMENAETALSSSAEMAATNGTDVSFPSAGATGFAARKSHLRASVSSVGRDAAAIMALTLGLISLPSSPFTIWAVFPAVIGLALGILGLRSSRRRSALIGLVVCCAALSFCLMRSVVLWHNHYQQQLQQEFFGDEF